jgi:hypothetical protein
VKAFGVVTATPSTVTYPAPVGFEVTVTEMDGNVNVAVSAIALFIVILTAAVDPL